MAGPPKFCWGHRPMAAFAVLVNRVFGMRLPANGSPELGSFSVRPATPEKSPSRHAWTGTDLERLHTPPLRVLFIVDEEEALVAPDWSARRSAELVAIQTLAFGRNVLRASNTLFRQNSNSDPCRLLVPDFVIRLTCPKAACPRSAV